MAKGFVVALLTVLMVAGCSRGVPDGLPDDVKASMQSTLDTDAGFASFDLTVRSVTLVKAQGNEYDGLAKVSTPTGPERTVAVHVTFDGEQMLWKTEPGAFMFAAQEQFAVTPPQ